MVNVAGSFSIFFLATWFLLAILFGIFYKKIKKLIFSTSPQNGIYVYILWWSAPPVISGFLASLMFVPGVRNIFVTSHCHNHCDNEAIVDHVPLIGNTLAEVAGICILAFICILYLYKLARYLSNVLKLRQLLKQVTCIQDEYQIIETPNPMVFTIGWFKPTICISRGLLDQASERDIQVVLLHEKMHQTRKDNLLLLLGHILTLMLPPKMSTDLRGQLRLLTELICDELSAKEYDRISVAEAIINVHKIINNKSSHSLEARVEKLLSNEPPVSLDRFYVNHIVLSIAIALLLIIEPAHYLYEWIIH